MVYIVGIGPGSKDYLLPAARQTIEKADTLIGGERQIAHFNDLSKKMIILKGSDGSLSKQPFSLAMDYIRKNSKQETIAILVSGDPGLFSLLNLVSKNLDENEYEVIPGLSSVQLAMARLKQTWQDAVILSVHGRELEQLLPAFESGKTMIIFTDYKNTPSGIASFLLEHGADDRSATVAENLSYSDECVEETTLKSLEKDSSSRSCQLSLLIIHKKA